MYFVAHFAQARFVVSGFFFYHLSLVFDQNPILNALVFKYGFGGLHVLH